MRTFFKSTRGAAFMEYQYVSIVALIAIAAVGIISPFAIDRNQRNSENIEAVLTMDEDIFSSPSLASTPLASTTDTGGSEIFETPEVRYACFNEGIVAGGQTRIRSVNSFSEGFCLHGNEGVWLRNNNIFAFGAVISAPSEEMLFVPPSGNNEGVEEAFTIAKLDIDIPQTLAEALNFLIDPALQGRPDYLDPFADVIQVSSNDVDISALTKGRVYNIACDSSKPLTFSKRLTISEVGIITNCNLKFPNDFRIEDAVIATTSTDVKSINSPQGLIIGRNDSCEVGGGAQILTMGGMDIASDLEMYGGHLVAAQDINIAAWIDGEGALLLSGENISGKSNINMQSCDGVGMEDNLVLTWWEVIILYLFG